MFRVVHPKRPSKRVVVSLFKADDQEQVCFRDVTKDNEVKERKCVDMVKGHKLTDINAFANSIYLEEENILISYNENL